MACDAAKTWTQGGIIQTTWYFYNALGQPAAEYSDRPPANTGTSWFFTDMPGSVRAITKSLLANQTRNREITAAKETMTELGIKTDAGTINVIPARRFLLNLPESMA
ncbi:MAG TPA: hypothetical protein VLL97_09825 [Acidobacteriota bacterium]|nr:hypothetical protein [Acidobacteriota bacterium]